jgi:hypothetical protein
MPNRLLDAPTKVNCTAKKKKKKQKQELEINKLTNWANKENRPSSYPSHKVSGVCLSLTDIENQRDHRQLRVQLPNLLK